MPNKGSDSFKKTMDEGYAFSGKSILLGAGICNGKAVPGVQIKMPLSTFNRHGLIAGATGTGKTKTIQLLAEALSDNGVSVLLMDIKGDISGIAKPGAKNAKIDEREKFIGGDWKSTGYPVELMSISSEKGLRLRATISEFGPLLLAKILELNDNQQGAVTVVFKYCDDKGLPLLDIKDFRTALQYVSGGEGAQEIQAYGAISSATVGVIMRKLLELEQQGADKFFGEKSFDVADLLRKDSSGRGYINILRLCDIQDKPKLFSSFMLCLLSEVYSKFPELGDRAEPKLVIFIDEAHLIFREATKALMSELETVIKLIRSKGVGIFFCTQVPGDVPDALLSQLGAKFQHALRAFTAKDRKDIKLVSQNYPSTEFYKTDELLTELGIGEALVTVLSEKGTPTPLVQTMLSPPQSRMDILTPDEQDEIVRSSSIAREYNQAIDRDSAYEMLMRKIHNAPEVSESPAGKPQGRGREEEESGPGIVDTLVQASRNPLVRSVTTTIVRGVLGAILGSTRRR